MHINYEWWLLVAHFVECGDGTLVHKFYWCDGWPECSDNHADELKCELYSMLMIFIFLLRVRRREWEITDK